MTCMDAMGGAHDRGNRNTWRRLFATSALVCAVSGASIAHAETSAAPPASAATSAAVEKGVSTTLPEVIVIATRRAENVQKVAVAVTPIGAKALQTEGITDLTQLQFHSPSLVVSDYVSPYQGSFVIRGIPETTTYFAEAPAGPTFTAASLYDMSSVQILNGPQGTLFGRTNVGGAVLLEPAKPVFNKFSGFIDLTGGEVGSGSVTGGLARTTIVANLPIIQDHLAVRVSLNQNYLQGYTEQLGTGQRLNETNNYSGRLSVFWSPGSGKFTDWAVLNYFGAKQSGAGYVQTAVNTNLGLFHLPASLSAPGGSTYGPAYFGAACSQAVSYGLSPSVSSCENQRLGLLSGLLPTLQTEQNRINSGGSNALNYTGNGVGGIPNELRFNQLAFINQAQYDFGQVGPTTVTFRNISSVQMQTGTDGINFDGEGGDILGAAIGHLPGNATYTECAKQHVKPNEQATISLCNGPWAYQYSEEAQLRGVVGDNLMTWLVGGFYENTPYPKNLTGPYGILKDFEGTLTPCLCWTPAVPYSIGGQDVEEAIYSQETLNLGWLVPFIDGLHLTGGVRYTWDYNTQISAAVNEDFSNGALTPGARQVAVANSAGWDTDVTLAADLKPNWLLYVTSRSAYVPGGVNPPLPGVSVNLPDYGPTYGPELVSDYEIGTKFTFSVGDVHARLNFAAYQLNYSNIQVLFTSSATNGTGGLTSYEANAAAAKIEGAEFQGELIYHNWDISGSYSYMRANYTKWYGADPLGVENVPGSGYCAPAQSTATTCVLDLKSEPFPNIPNNQGNISVQYTQELPNNLGRMMFTATGFVSSGYFLTQTGLRDMQQYGLKLKDVTQPTYEKLNLRVDWSHIYGSHTSIAAFVNNVTDTHYAVEQYDIMPSLGELWKLYGEPRSWGVEMRYEF